MKAPEDLQELEEEWGSKSVSSYLGGNLDDGLRDDPFEALMLRQ